MKEKKKSPKLCCCSCQHPQSLFQITSHLHACLFSLHGCLEVRTFFPPSCLRQRCREVEKRNLCWSDTSPRPTTMVSFLTDQPTNSRVLRVYVEGRGFKNELIKKQNKERGICTRNSPSSSLLTSVAVFLSFFNLPLLCGR